ncbi:hypothetical protein L3X38_001019 [Prunus dulcis]|uniref:Uncharacterized protein n=1 Tax=Prunus dulcis TaxID=3755 RepID=A0AAD4WTB4_PRUDU|nr:hypothetical protein L3X38_001019 [Prunus dulcis]
MSLHLDLISEKRVFLLLTRATCIQVTTKNWKSEKNIRWALIYYGNGQGEGMFDYASSFGNLHVFLLHSNYEVFC